MPLERKRNGCQRTDNGVNKNGTDYQKLNPTPKHYVRDGLHICHLQRGLLRHAFDFSANLAGMSLTVLEEFILLFNPSKETDFASL